jgi:hypothetical protein
VGVVGDVEEVAVLVEEHVVAPFDGDVLAEGDDPVVVVAFAGAVGELDDVLGGGA